jgi:hypothetical protein
MALMYFFCLVLGIYFMVAAPTTAETSAAEASLMGLIFAALGLLLSIPFAIGPFLQRRPGAWTFDLVLICIGLGSACCLPVTIPLLLAWLKPETKAYFGKS